jgi:hypothetical protein
MRIDCYLSPECGSEEALRENIALALRETGVHAEVLFHRIDDAQAVAMKLSGSPSVFINGKELLPLGGVGFS